MIKDEKMNKLTSKDLINVGIYTAMYISTFFVIGLLTTIPILYPFFMFLVSFICGIPMMLYYTKINKFGMLTITGIISGIFFFIIGYTWLSLVFWITSAFLGDIILKFGEYKNFKITVLSYCVFAIGEMGCTSPLFLTGDSQWNIIRESMGDKYADTLMSMMPYWMFYAGFGIIIIGGFCGAILGHKILKKHFKRAGIV